MLDMTLDDVIAANKAAKRKNKEDTKGNSEEGSDGATKKVGSPGADDGDEAMVDSSRSSAPKQEGGGGRGGGYRGGRGGGGKFGGRGQGRNSRRHMPYSRNNNTNSNKNNNSNPSGGDNDGGDDSDGRSRRVYVGNLSWDVTWRELKDHMKTTGCEVSRADVLSSHDGRSKGCGIVEFATSEGARRAVLTLNDTDLMGRQIFVREDREGGSGGGGEQSRGSGGGGVVGGGGGRGFASGGDAQSRRCYVGNLSWDVAWQDLKDHMRQVGDVVFSEVMTEGDGRSKGCGIVEYATAAEAQEAISTLTDSDLKGRMIFVREDRETSSGGPSRQCSVYVGNLAFETSWQDLKDHMRAAGNVDQANVLMSDDGRSKGCGIVQYQKPQEAARAIRELQNSMLHGRPIFVREDREAGGGRGSGGGGGGGGGGVQLFVGNLSFDTTWKELKDHFRPCGDVERAEVMKGFGTVRFYKAKDATNAIQRLNNVELMGRNLEVRIDAKAS